jgi:5-methylcytosine-specific restriction enzyme subunit McrC
MAKSFYIREWGRLVLGPENRQKSADELVLNERAWSFLSDFASSQEKEHRYLTFVRKDILQVRNYVGVITAPDGTQIEILPKTSDDDLGLPDLVKSRKLLLKMLRTAEGVFPVQTTEADLTLEKMPLPEVLIGIFLQQLAETVRKGVRKDYQRIEAEEKFLKGQLQVAKQLRKSPGKQHRFHIEYDVFSENRAENRLICSALISIGKWSQNAANQKLSRELRFVFDEVPESYDYSTDFSQWQTTRDMAYYQPLLPWLKLILNQLSPFAVKDKHAGTSFLFPMEMLFEKYVYQKLAKTLPYPLTLKEQVSSLSLAKQNDAPVFQLKPDLAIYNEETKTYCAVLDTKWKRINQNQTYENGAPDKKAGISQSDMYQMFAYGHKYLKGSGRMMLIYPKYSGFTERLQAFQLSENLYLDVVPFCLEKDVLELTAPNLKDWSTGGMPNHNA